MKIYPKKTVYYSTIQRAEKEPQKKILRYFNMKVKPLTLIHTENIKPWHTEPVRNKLTDHSFDDVYAEYKRIVGGDT